MYRTSHRASSVVPCLRSRPAPRLKLLIASRMICLNAFAIPSMSVGIKLFFHWRRMTPGRFLISRSRFPNAPAVSKRIEGSYAVSRNSPSVSSLTNIGIRRTSAAVNSKMKGP